MIILKKDTIKNHSLLKTKIITSTIKSSKSHQKRIREKEQSAVWRLSIFANFLFLLLFYSKAIAGGFQNESVRFIYGLDFTLPPGQYPTLVPDTIAPEGPFSCPRTPCPRLLALIESLYNPICLCVIPVYTGKKPYISMYKNRLKFDILWTDWHVRISDCWCST